MEINKSGQFRKKKIYFTQVSNIALKDNRLSLKAKGLYSLIQSYLTIEDFTLYKNTLKKHLKEGDKAFESAWKELKDSAYLIQYRLQDSKTKQFYYEYELLDEPNLKLANKIHGSQNRKKYNKKCPLPIPPKKEGMGNGHNGKREQYNNTNLNNTNLNNIIITSSNNDEEVIKLIHICNLNNFKLNKTDIKSLLLVYNFDKIAKAIITASSTKSHIKNYKGYIISTLNDMEKIKKININIENKKSYANFTQREYDYTDLEKQLLGWEDK